MFNHVLDQEADKARALENRKKLFKLLQEAIIPVSKSIPFKIKILKKEIVFMLASPLAATLTPGEELYVSSGARIIDEKFIELLTEMHRFKVAYGGYMPDKKEITKTYISLKKSTNFFSSFLSDMGGEFKFIDLPDVTLNEGIHWTEDNELYISVIMKNINGRKQSPLELKKDTVFCKLSIEIEDE